MSRIVRVTGRALPLRGHDIDTDRIIPARYLKAVSFEGLEQHVFADDRTGGGHPFDDPRYTGASVLLVKAVEQDPLTTVTMDLESLAVEGASLRIPADMPSSARDALTSGLWDGTGMLLQNLDLVRSVAARLPYTRGFAERP